MLKKSVFCKKQKKTYQLIAIRRQFPCVRTPIFNVFLFSIFTRYRCRLEPLRNRFSTYICYLNSYRYRKCYSHLIKVLVGNPFGPFHAHLQRSCGIRYIRTLDQHPFHQVHFLRAGRWHCLGAHFAGRLKREIIINNMSWV